MSLSNDARLAVDPVEDALRSRRTILTMRGLDIAIGNKSSCDNGRKCWLLKLCRDATVRLVSEGMHDSDYVKEREPTASHCDSEFTLDQSGDEHETQTDLVSI